MCRAACGVWCGASLSCAGIVALGGAGAVVGVAVCGLLGPGKHKAARGQGV